MKQWLRGITRMSGLCLICGEGVSGKTTTLNASVRELDRLGKKVYAAFGPAEHPIPYAGATSPFPSAGEGFAQAIRNFMRADPDVLVLGEIRDAETAMNAIKAVGAGQLVIATLDAGSIASVVSRLRDLGIPSCELRHFLRAVLVQGLVRMPCARCGGHGYGDPCQDCGGSGLSDRMLVSECHCFDSPGEVERLVAIANGPQEPGRRLPWKRMVDDAIDKVLAGDVAASEAERLLGTEFAARMAERAPDLPAHALGRGARTTAPQPPARGVARPPRRAPIELMPLVRADDVVACWQAGEASARALRGLFGEAFDEYLRERGIPIPRDDEAA